MGKNNENEAPAWANELLEKLQELTEGINSLKNPEQQKFSMSEAVNSWLKEKQEAKNPAEVLEGIYNRKREVDAKGWPAPKKEREIPEELLERVKEITKYKLDSIKNLMGGDDPRE